MATVAEKRNYLTNEIQTLDDATLDRIYNYVISIEGSDTQIHRYASEAEVDAALAEIDRKYSKDMEVLAQ